MRAPFSILAGALLIAVSVLVVFNTGDYVVYGIDNWTGEPFVQSRPYSE